LSFSTNKPLDFPAGFYAAAYQLPDGTIVISYRGTDNLTGRNAAAGSNDFTNGYPIGAVSYFVSQGNLAIEFYQGVQNLAGIDTTNIVLTGHSMGGGLAGYVAALYNAQAVVFDPMPFTAANDVNGCAPDQRRAA
jgi:fermentation-respiration switch protein FrsA (DUF1100 family)